MEDFGDVVRANRMALDQLIEASERAGPVWTTPRARGKWSPAQVVEHVARSLEAAGDIYAGRPSALPTLPKLLRPVARSLLFRRVLNRGTFPKAKTNKAMDPASGPETPAAGRARLDAAFDSFERELRGRVERSSEVETSAFGTVSVADYARFVELHTLHHLRQMPRA